MKLKTENYQETKDMLGWLMCVVDEVKRYAPQTDTPTLFRARDIALKNGEAGKLKILTRELFSRLELGDTVYVQPFDESPESNDKIVTTVTGWTPSGKMVHINGLCGCWNWQYLFIPTPKAYEAEK